MKYRVNKDRCAGWTQKFKIRGGQTVLSGYLRVSLTETGQCHGIVVDVQREGSMGRALMHAFTASMNIGLQSGIPLKVYLDAFRGWKFEPAGRVECSAMVAEAESILDYVVKELEAAFYPTTKENTDDTQNDSSPSSGPIPLS